MLVHIYKKLFLHCYCQQSCSYLLLISTVDIGSPPVITVHPLDAVILLCINFTNHTLTCEADGASSYNWERQNGVIPSDSTGVNTNTLTLINLQPEDAGNYQCVATKASGSSESNYSAITLSSEHIHIHMCSNSLL